MNADPCKENTTLANAGFSNADLLNGGAQRAIDHPVFKGFQDSGGAKARFRRWAVGQFGHPRGFWGFVAGRIMALRPSNIERNRWAVHLLEVKPTDRVLEIGFGPGLAIDRLQRRAGEGIVYGVDHSAEMMRQAARRNARAIREGRVKLHLGSVSDLPEQPVNLDKILAVNAVMFWSNPAGELKNLRERLRPGGRIALALQPRARDANFKTALEAGERLKSQLNEAGFRETALKVLPMKPVAAVCATAIR